MLPDHVRKEVVEGLISILGKNLLAVILYGSVARNEATDESDIDIAIIIKDVMDEKVKKAFISWAAELDIRYERVFSIIDIQESNMKKWGKVLPFYQNVKDEGIVLWKAA